MERALHSGPRQQLWAPRGSCRLAAPCPRGQLPGFLTGLERFAPPSVHLIYTFPNFKSCATIDLSPQLAYWKKVTKIPLPLRASPMQGWLDAIPYVKTKYSMLLHNDGCAAPPAPPHARHAAPRRPAVRRPQRSPHPRTRRRPTPPDAARRRPTPPDARGGGLRLTPSCATAEPQPTPVPPHPAPAVGCSRLALRSQVTH